MSLPYVQFAIWILSDLAVRSPSAWPDRVIFDGNYISPQFVLPHPERGETKQHYAMRLKAFRSRLPRGSDASYRLALAMEAFVRDGEKTEAAARFVLETLENPRSASKVQAVLWLKRGLPWKPVKFRIGATLRGRRTKPKQSDLSAYERQVETIRTLVSRFKRHHPDFDKRFDEELARFRERFCRDVEWYAEAERNWKLKIVESEKNLGPYHVFTATLVVRLASLYHEQGKYAEAVPFYWRAWDVYMATPLLYPQLREVLLSHAAVNIRRCVRGGPQMAAQQYTGPREVSALLGP